MKHELILSEHATLSEHAGYITCDLASSPPGPVALGLALLHEGLIDQLILRPENSRWVLRVCSLDGPRDHQLSRYGAQRIQLGLGRATLEAVLCFFLRYHRDGHAEVDHLDVEGTWDAGEGCDFILRVSEVMPPVGALDRRALQNSPGTGTGPSATWSAGADDLGTPPAIRDLHGQLGIPPRTIPFTVMLMAISSAQEQMRSTAGACRT